MRKVKVFIAVIILITVVCCFTCIQHRDMVYDKEPVIMYNGYIFDCNDPRGITAENLPGEIIYTIEIQSTTEGEWPAEHLQSNSFAVGEKFYFVSGWPNIMYWYNSDTEKYYPYEMNYDSDAEIVLPETGKTVTLVPMLMYDGRLYVADSYSTDYTAMPADKEKQNIYVTEMISPLEIPCKDLQCNFRSERTQLYFRDGDTAIYLDCWDYTHGLLKMVKVE